MCMIYCLNTDNDFELTNVNESTVAIIPREENMTCFDLLAIDDVFVEDVEEFAITAEALHPNDVNTNATVTILDNDG